MDHWHQNDPILKYSGKNKISNKHKEEHQKKTFNGGEGKTKQDKVVDKSLVANALSSPNIILLINQLKISPVSSIHNLTSVFNPIIHNQTLTNQ